VQGTTVLAAIAGVIGGVVLSRYLDKGIHQVASFDQRQYSVPDSPVYQMRGRHPIIVPQNTSWIYSQVPIGIFPSREQQIPNSGWIQTSPMP
jgi:hypothetical protein